MARGTAPRVATEAVDAKPCGHVSAAQASTTDEPAHSIAEALEQLIRAREVEEAIAEWAREG